MNFHQQYIITTEVPTQKPYSTINTPIRIYTQNVLFFSFVRLPLCASSLVLSDYYLISCEQRHDAELREEMDVVTLQSSRITQREWEL